MTRRLWCIGSLALMMSLSLLSRSSWADKFVYRNEANQQVEVDAKLYATGQGMLALEKSDGSMDLVPEGAVMKRTPGNDPEPITPVTMLGRLESEFGKEKFRGIVSDEYVIGVVLMAPLPKSSEKRVEAALKKSASYMTSIEKTFETFVRGCKVVPTPAKYPLVVLIFETDEVFEDYATRQMGTSRGLSAGNIAGYYSQLTNGLYIRMSECHTFATPLHEAIHQQCFNRGVLPRLAPLPKWFVEGMATGFEGSGEKIKADPTKLNQAYARSIATTRRIPGDLDWDDIAKYDAAFVGDVFAGEAYFHAWSMHWLLVTKYRDKYSTFLKQMGAVEPLTERKPPEQASAFESAFGKRAVQYQREFIPAFEAAVKKEKFVPSRDDLPGVISKQMNLAGIDVTAEATGLDVVINGTLKNISPLREMAYYVTVHTETGAYCDWVFPKVIIGGTKKMMAQSMNKVMQGGIGGRGRTFAVRVKAVPADSDEAARWASGQVPVLEMRRLQ